MAHAVELDDNGAGEVTDKERAVRERYSAGAQAVQPELCCPVQYNADYLEIIPQEILDRDYGCGDPTPYLKRGDTVLDLGSGGGKICFIAAQMVGPNGRVIGVDCNDEMLTLARKYQSTVAETLGYSNVEFRTGLIQDLKLDLVELAARIADRPIQDQNDWLWLRNAEHELRTQTPMIADDSVDCVVSNCVLNLVRNEDRQQLFAEIFRVLKKGGKAVISDIVGDEDVPASMQSDPELWSGCISGAFREDRFLEAFEAAGFYGIELIKREKEPWRTIQGTEFRSVTIQAYKGDPGPCLERHQAVIYKGPFQKITDEFGHEYYRGQRMAVCDKTYKALQCPPYAGMFETVEPRELVPLEKAGEFDCQTTQIRDARSTKGANFQLTTIEGGESCCGPSGDCC